MKLNWKSFMFHGNFFNKVSWESVSLVVSLVVWKLLSETFSIKFLGKVSHVVSFVVQLSELE